MADVKLGPAGAEVTLPNLMFTGSPPALPVTVHKQIEKSTMSDGSRRWAFIRNKKEWPLVFGFLTKAQLDSLSTLNALNQILRFQDNNVDATWYNVVITAFTWEPERTDIRSLARYKCRMTLEEA